MFNEAMIPDFERSNNTNNTAEFGKVVEENKNLKSQLQNQAKEISSLNAQLKFVNPSSGGITRKTSTSRILDSSSLHPAKSEKTQDITYRK